MARVYEERTSRVPGAVVWHAVSDGSPSRVLPDGCLDLLWLDGAVVVAGPDTVAEVHRSPAGSRVTGLRFAPGYGPAVLGTPAAALTDHLVPLDALWSGAAAGRLAQQVAEAPDPGVALEDAALAAARPDDVDPLAAHVVARLRAGTPVGAVAAEVGLSTRQLHRRSLDAFGYGPKLLERVLRLQRALALARAGTPFAEVAAHAGYADQAHLARNVRALAGIPLGQLLDASA